MAVISYKCSNCDGELVFNPKMQKYRCEYCASAFSQEELAQMQPATEEEKPARDTGAAFGTEPTPSGTKKETGTKEETAASAGAADNTENSRKKEEKAGAGNEEGMVYNCPSCGAQIVTDDTTAATFCYYCHNPVVLSGRVSGEFLPHKIIPFTIDRKQATDKFMEYVHTKKFVPKAFFNKSQIEKISGVYFPYWMVDMDMAGSMQAEARNVRVWRSGDTEYTETKVYRIEREGDIHLEDITRNALKKANSKLSERILPYDVSKVQKFHMGYLSGFLAEKRDIERKELEANVENEAKEYGKKLLRETVNGYSSVSVHNCHMNFQKENWDYIMLPVWTVTYKGKDGKIYYYSMNGQNGNVSGELPIDYKKVWLLSIVIFIVVLILGLIGGFIL